MLGIPGLLYIPNYLSPDEADDLMAAIDAAPWEESLSRRTQQYGFNYAHKSASLDASARLGDLPEWLQPLARQVVADGLFLDEPDQAILNEYEPGQGIGAHVDAPHLFGPVVASVSLLSSALMEFKRGDEKRSLLLEPRSILVMRGEARLGWKHGMAARKSDVIEGVAHARKRRVSVTFRTVTI